MVQFDTRTRQKKVIAFLHPFYRQKYGLTPAGTYSVAWRVVSADTHRITGSHAFAVK